MSRGISDQTRKAVAAILANPDIDIREDGSIWRRTGKPDLNGQTVVAVPSFRRTNSDSSITVPTHLLVYAKFKGPLPDYVTKFINFKDGNPLNQAANNLVLGETAYSRRRTGRQRRDDLTIDDEPQMRKEFEDGMTIREIAFRHNTTSNVVREVVGLPPRRRPKRNK